MSAGWIAFALAIGWLAFAYAGYPLLLLLLRRIAPRPIRRADLSPPLSVIIAVHNGAAFLREKLENTLGLGYPGELQVIVASDASTDATESIAEAFADRGVVLVRNPVRSGKEMAQAAGIEAAKGDLLVFTDVTALLEPNALRAIAMPFADPDVGAVTSEDAVDSNAGEGAYVRYEMAIRRMESDVSTIIGLSGSFFAARRELCNPWPTDLASDFRMALEVARRGLRAVSEPEARARYAVVESVGAEWSRKVRTYRRGIAVLLAYRDLLHPRHGRAALALWGHKLARFTSPFALILAFGASGVMAPFSAWAGGLLALQLLAYAAAAFSLRGGQVSSVRALRLAGFFLLVNASMLVAWAYHLSGRRAVTWQPTGR